MGRVRNVAGRTARSHGAWFRVPTGTVGSTSGGGGERAWAKEMRSINCVFEMVSLFLRQI